MCVFVYFVQKTTNWINWWNLKAVIVASCCIHVDSNIAKKCDIKTNTMILLQFVWTKKTVPRSPIIKSIADFFPARFGSHARRIVGHRHRIKMQCVMNSHRSSDFIIYIIESTTVWFVYKHWIRLKYLGKKKQIFLNTIYATAMFGDFIPCEHHSNSAHGKVLRKIWFVFNRMGFFVSFSDFFFNLGNSYRKMILFIAMIIQQVSW